jgi:hypothetical protein
MRMQRHLPFAVGKTTEESLANGRPGGVDAVIE